MNPLDMALIVAAGVVLMYGTYALTFMVAYLIREWRGER